MFREMRDVLATPILKHSGSVVFSTMAFRLSTGGLVLRKSRESVNAFCRFFAEGEIGGTPCMRSHIVIYLATTISFAKPFIFKIKIEKEGLPRDSPAGLGAVVLGLYLLAAELPARSQMLIRNSGDATSVYRSFPWAIIVGSVMAIATTLILHAIGMKGAVPLGIASGLLNLLPFLGLILSLALPLAAALLQFSTPGPYIVIIVTILFLHIVSANFLLPKFIANRVSIRPVAATVGILFWRWLWGVMGLLLAVPLTAHVKMIADLHPSLCHLSNLLALTPRPIARWMRYGETVVGRTIPYLRGRRGVSS
jgi:AI-2E family transporter